MVVVNHHRLDSSTAASSSTSFATVRGGGSSSVFHSPTTEPEVSTAAQSLTKAHHTKPDLEPSVDTTPPRLLPTVSYEPGGGGGGGQAMEIVVAPSSQPPPPPRVVTPPPPTTTRTRETFAPKSNTLFSSVAPLGGCFCFMPDSTSFFWDDTSNEEHEDHKNQKERCDPRGHASMGQTLPPALHQAPPLEHRDASESRLVIPPQEDSPAAGTGMDQPFFLGDIVDPSLAQLPSAPQDPDDEAMETNTLVDDHQAPPPLLEPQVTPHTPPKRPVSVFRPSLHGPHGSSVSLSPHVTQHHHVHFKDTTTHNLVLPSYSSSPLMLSRPSVSWQPQPQVGPSTPSPLASPSSASKRRRRRMMIPSMRMIPGASEDEDTDDEELPYRSPRHYNENEEDDDDDSSASLFEPLESPFGLDFIYAAAARKQKQQQRHQEQLHYRQQQQWQQLPPPQPVAPQLPFSYPPPTMTTLEPQLVARTDPPQASLVDPSPPRPVVEPRDLPVVIAFEPKATTTTTTCG